MGQTAIRTFVRISRKDIGKMKMLCRIQAEKSEAIRNQLKKPWKIREKSPKQAVKSTKRSKESIPKKVFQKIVREIVNEVSSGPLKVQLGAYNILQEVAEDMRFMKESFELNNTGTRGY
ncbi:unnamed protein product [Caenorhabditis angaria]|uniref:Histone H2A/H2B/H3 domain-containing protein n=1 Tax=Caenorhabditis angaria TaxID=860376 RepID=A0A9P1IJZ3_9PELO|nr:unnamed protein product [Caenorhabditis angaria]